MNKYEAERIRPMVWLTALHAAMSRGSAAKVAARNADEAVEEFKTRFPIEEEPEER